MISGKTISKDDSAEFFHKKFNSEISIAEWKETELFTPAEKKKLLEANGNVIPAEEVHKAQLKTEKFWREWGESRVKSYIEIIGPTLRPMWVQKKFFVDFGSDFEFGFKGTIDRVDEDGTVVDNKTSKGRWSENDVKYDLQCVGYALVYRILTGKIENKIQFDILVKTKTQEFKEQFQQIAMGIEPHKFDLYLQELTNTFRSLKDGRFSRRVHKFSGACSYCEFFDMCWHPHQVWSRAPTESEIKEFVAHSPENLAMVEHWISNETQINRLVNWYEIGQEFRQAAEKNPMLLSFWY